MPPISHSVDKRSGNINARANEARQIDANEDTTVRTDRPILIRSTMKARQSRLARDRETSRSVNTPQGRWTKNSAVHGGRREEPTTESIGRASRDRPIRSGAFVALSTRVSRVRFSCHEDSARLPVGGAQETQKGRGRRVGLINRLSRIRFPREEMRSYRWCEG